MSMISLSALSLVLFYFAQRPYTYPHTFFVDAKSRNTGEETTPFRGIEAFFKMDEKVVARTSTKFS